MNETTLLLEGVGPDEISETFLVQVMEFAEKSDLTVEGISILRK